MSALNTVLGGLTTTLELTVGALVIGTVGAVPLAILRRSGPKPVRGIVRFLIDFIRGIPAIVWLFVIYFGLGVIAMAYLAEIMRAGINSVYLGQEEAAQALGMSGFTAFTSVIGPQAARAALPAASTYAIGLLKDSSLASTIGVTEIVFRANAYSQQNYSPRQAFAIAGAVYLVISVIAAIVTRMLDHHLRARVAIS
jgi:His/Glu/Gln/Arg/opine family amino acid ABC transporter permease subunit